MDNFYKILCKNFYKKIKISTKKIITKFKIFALKNHYQKNCKYTKIQQKIKSYKIFMKNNFILKFANILSKYAILVFSLFLFLYYVIIFLILFLHYFK